MLLMAEVILKIMSKIMIQIDMKTFLKESQNPDFSNSHS